MSDYNWRARKFRVSFNGNSKLWARGRGLYNADLTPGREWCSTWPGLVTIALNSRFSADSTIWANVGASSKRYPPLHSLPIRRSSLSLSRMVVKPHQAGEAYRRETSVLAPGAAQGMNGGGAIGEDHIQVGRVKLIFYNLLSPGS